jgi:hypothetical protein
MKVKTLIVTALSLGVLIMLAGCEEAGNPDQTNTPQNQINTVTPNAPVTSVISQADKAAYDGAMKLNDPAFCDKITDETFKTSCKTALLDQKAQNEALTKMNATLCAKLSTKDAQEACKIQVEVAKASETQQIEKDIQFEKDQTLINEIIAANSYDKCNQIINKTFLETCNNLAIFHEAKTSKDKTICDKLLDKGKIPLCKEAVDNPTN